MSKDWTEEILGLESLVNKLRAEAADKRLEQAINIIQEFISDIENHGLEIVKESWPELFITYCRAVELLS